MKNETCRSAVSRTISSGVDLRGCQKDAHEPYVSHLGLTIEANTCFLHYQYEVTIMHTQNKKHLTFIYLFLIKPGS